MNRTPQRPASRVHFGFHPQSSHCRVPDFWIYCLWGATGCPGTAFKDCSAFRSSDVMAWLSAWIAYTRSGKPGLQHSTGVNSAGRAACDIHRQAHKDADAHPKRTQKLAADSNYKTGLDVHTSSPGLPGNPRTHRNQKLEHGPAASAADLPDLPATVLCARQPAPLSCPVSFPWAGFS